MPGLQCHNMGHNGHGINVYGVIMTLMGTLHTGGQSNLGSLSLLHRFIVWGTEDIHVANIYKDSILSSGTGSYEERTLEVRRTLACVIDELKITLNKSRLRMLDVPCGDMTWMSLFLSGRDDVTYTGLDIVPDLIEHHRDAYRKHNWHFRVQDVVDEPLTESHDLIFSRALTQHLTSGDTMKVLKHFSESGSHFVMMTTHAKFPNVELKYDIVGRFRPQNLEGPPYSLMAPMCAGDEGLSYNEHIALWKLPLKQRVV